MLNVTVIGRQWLPMTVENWFTEWQNAGMYMDYEHRQCKYTAAKFICTLGSLPTSYTIEEWS